MTDETRRDEISDDEVSELIGESLCASRPAPPKETLADYLARIAEEDRGGGPQSGPTNKPSK